MNIDIIPIFKDSKALACHVHADANDGQLPPGTSQRVDDNYYGVGEFSMFCYLLPHIEMEAMYNIVSPQMDTTPQPQDPVYSDTLGKRLAALNCPSDFGASSQNPYSNYCISAGDGFATQSETTNEDLETRIYYKPYCPDIYTGHHVTRGPFLVDYSGGYSTENDPTYGHFSWAFVSNPPPGQPETVSLNSINDGLSNTALIGERICGYGLSSESDKPTNPARWLVDCSGYPDDNTFGIAGNLVVAYAIYDPFTGGGDVSSWFCPQNLLNHFQGGTISSDLSGQDINLFYRSMDFWSLSFGITAWFNTILPPNSPGALTNGEWEFAFVSASSYHSGGVNIARCDGSVSFINNSINCGDLTKTIQPSLSGPSRYGVWGAFGSANGDEVVAP
ncbi:MAG: DUF1559 domain-containing protein [Planctomycetaceae bacterium]|nr:DUF1559 domain-containing protein [Planctomycetaceae bacterium]